MQASRPWEVKLSAKKYGVRRQAKRDAALDGGAALKFAKQSKEKRRRASLAAALHRIPLRPTFFSPAGMPALPGSLRGHGLEVGCFFFSCAFDVRQQVKDFVGAQQIHQTFGHGRDF